MIPGGGNSLGCSAPEEAAPAAQGYQYQNAVNGQEAADGYVEAVAEPMVEDIEPFSDDKIMSLVEIAPAPGKGRCMYVRNGYEPGGLILIEKPLFVIVPNDNIEIWNTINSLHEKQPLLLSPLWHHAALITIMTGTKEKLEVMRGKWVLDPDPPVSEDVYRILEATCVAQADGTFVYSNQVVVDPKFYQFLLQVWPLNAFGHTTDPNGLVLYNKISFLAHSCDATACWHHVGDDYFVLRARRRLRPGDELTISYLGEPDLLAPTHKRRELLYNWSFYCECPRCIIPVDCARGFLCKLCRYGRVGFYQDSNSTRLVSDACTLCDYVFTESDITEYLDLERAYAERIDCIDANDLCDIQEVYNHARNVFKQHWCLYRLETLLFECFKERGEADLARYYLQQRISFADAVMRRPLYCVAFMHEEYADMLLASAGIDKESEQIPEVNVNVELLNIVMGSYFRAATLLAVLSGLNHAYYYTVLYKHNRSLVNFSGTTPISGVCRCGRICVMALLKAVGRALGCLFRWRSRRSEQIAEFKECCQLVAIKRAGGQLDDDNFWVLYGFFKQTVVGDFNLKDVEDSTEAERRKWASWQKCKGMTKNDAMAAYIALVRNLFGYPTNTDAMHPTMSNAISRPKLQSDDASDAHESEGLFTLVAENHVGMVDLLLKANPHLVNIRSPEGLTALHIAADRGHLEVIQCLIKHGADIDAMDDNNDTPLLVAAAAGNRAAVTMLLRNGAIETPRKEDKVEAEQTVDAATSCIAAADAQQ
ncbi:apical complex lysine methyltransferase [Babesia ovata]|uniref:Apical complex lysine methyltransferase n=1 Tax=Babesia ovata TaxID=189622 RepID=A0A2H6KB99_9APIC|nr:apical complex lysine methyltransferase [Babesia ovata]GBE60264.1 apical complex lysine methyltransferase [Babesia ovata]